MKENPADIVTEKFLEQTKKVSEGIARQLKGTKPFATELIPPTVKIWAMDYLGLMDMVDIRNDFGDEAINRLGLDIEKLRTDGRRVK